MTYKNAVLLPKAPPTLAFATRRKTDKSARQHHHKNCKIRKYTVKLPGCISWKLLNSTGPAGWEGWGAWNGVEKDGCR